MGSCFSKKANTTALTLAPQISDLKSNHPPPTNDHQPFKKEIFVIKHRISHEIDRHSDRESDKNPSPTAGVGDRLRTPSCSKEELDSILIQCDRLSRNNSAGAQNPNFRRRRSRSERSFDSACNSNANASNHHEDAVDADIDADYTDDALDHRHRHRQAEIRVSSSIRSNSKERRISISPSRRSNSKERRISISPTRRSQSPFSNKNPNPVAAGGASSSSSSLRPAKMVSVPATDKSNNAGVQQPVAAGPVKRIHVKRNVSPARTNIRIFSDDHSQDQESSSSTREADYRRKSLVEIDNNAGRSATTQPRDTKRTRRLSRDLDMNPEPVFGTSPSPPSYASLLLEDIQNFHKKNTANAAAATPASFALPECVNKACLIMEAVADMNSNSRSLCSDDRWRNSKTMKNDSSGMS